MAGQRQTVTIENQAAFMASLKTAVAALEVRSVDGLKRLAFDAQSAARRYCPVDTGRLRASIVTTGPDREGRGWVMTVGTNVVYAPFVEFGTRRMRAQPYLRPGLMEAATKGIRP